jgi:hypothetical protein
MHSCPGQRVQRRLLAGWTHNPPVVGSIPTRPTKVVIARTASSGVGLRVRVGIRVSLVPLGLAGYGMRNTGTSRPGPVILILAMSASIRALR